MAVLVSLISERRDEILYHAKLHPEQYSNTFSDAQLKQLYASILYVCKTAVDALGDSTKFPEEWLFNHRWGKGKKDAPSTLPNGAKLTFLTVGGRTSCVVPSVQKKTGAVAAEIKVESKDGEDGGVKVEEADDAKENGKSKRGNQRSKRKASEEETEDTKKPRARRARK